MREPKHRAFTQKRGYQLQLGSVLISLFPLPHGKVNPYSHVTQCHRVTYEEEGLKTTRMERFLFVEDSLQPR